MGLFSSFFSKKEKSSSSEEEKKIALSGSDQERMKLAKSPKASQEIICYMAVKDNNADIRLALAGRLAALLPDLSRDKQSSLYKYAVEALGVLALDEVLKIRSILSSVLKDYVDAPPDVVGRLARDIEREVSEPILKYCLALPDEDLLEILKAYPASWAVQAIASRPKLSGPVSGAVIETDDREAGRILIENKGADISLEDLKHIVDKAKDYPEWQKPIAMHKNISAEMAKELIGFVDQSVKNILLERTDFPPELTEELTTIVKRRKKFADRMSMEGSAEDRVLSYLKEGKLDDEAIGDALAVRDKEFIMVAFSALLKTSKANVQKICEMKTPKSIVAMCWKAGFSMRTCLKIQQEMVQISHKELIYPRGGTDYPLTPEDMNWQLDFLGIGNKNK
ncbi:MAG TPA: DUF2336 domain-containing protein [Alphaproteobacteria bacterium]|nr:DUF2336 domain-containing protein [Alphaproteobacteria bacterium]